MTCKYFPGGNTGEGFYNLFSGIIPDKDKVTRVMILKGGPGVGKSTLMKKCANMCEKENMKVELFYCSGDPDSLDAVRIIDKNVVILDGTAPHIIDPVFPGVDDEIINLGVYISPRVREHRDNLVPMFERNKYSYTLAYSYLSTAMILKNTNNSAASKIYNTAKMKMKISELAGEQPHDGGEKRELFLDAITCKGRIHFDNTMNFGKKVYFIDGFGSGLFLKQLVKMYEESNACIFYDALCPKEIAHIYLPYNKIWFTTAKTGNGERIDMNEFRLFSIPDYVRYNDAQIENLVNKAIENLAVCKTAHDEIEHIYTEFMDFDGVEKETEKITEVISRM